MKTPAKSKGSVVSENVMTHLPERYGHTEFVLMVVHPLLVYGYWEITPEDTRQAQQILGAEMKGACAVLRMYDVSFIDFNGSNAHHAFDIEVGLEAPGWYIHLWSPEKSYVADVGFRTRKGRFHAIVRSNTIHTPRTSPSPRTDEQWARVRFSRGRRPDASRALEYVSPPYLKTTAPEPVFQERIVHDFEALPEYLSGIPTSRRA
jgi:hypothetical protein